MMRWLLLPLPLPLSLLLFATAADARSVLLRWTHNPQPSQATGFRIYLASLPAGPYAAPIDAGRPTPDAAGIYSFTVQAPDTETRYAVLTAYNTAGESGHSNQRALPPPLPPPGAPVLLLD